MSTPVFRAFGISRLRMATDGVGITTLVCGYGCPLRCRYCLNRWSWLPDTKTRDYTPEELYRVLKIDDLYFRATGGGVTFGGGEPLLWADCLPAFRAVCGDGWQINVETSLAVPREAVTLAADAADCLIVDVKSADDAIYRAYTGMPSALAWDNLAYLLARIGPDRLIARVPLIPAYSDEASADRTEERLRQMGITRIDRFVYQIRDEQKVSFS